MKRTNQVIAAVVVATALCADRVAPTMTQAPRPQVTEIARTIVARFTRNLRRVIAAMPMFRSRMGGRFSRLPRLRLPVQPVLVHASACSPFRFRLPPPSF